MTTTFNFNFTEHSLSKIFPTLPDISDWYQVLSNTLPINNITTIQQVAEFLAQTAYESANYTRLIENMNYSAAALRSVFPHYFPTTAAALQYARQPQKIANLVYGSRMGNGPPESGEGWKYRGRGILQLTGKDNYAKASHDIYQDDRLVTNPDLVCEKQAAVETACWFWDNRSLNDLIDAGNLMEVTHRINGGYNGAAARTANYNNFLAILQQG